MCSLRFYAARNRHGGKCKLEHKENGKTSFHVANFHKSILSTASPIKKDNYHNSKMYIPSTRIRLEVNLRSN